MALTGVTAGASRSGAVDWVARAVCDTGCRAGPPRNTSRMSTNWPAARPMIEARGRRRRDPPLACPCATVDRDGRTSGIAMHAGRTLERFEPAHDLRLLRGQAIGGKRLVSLVVRLVAEAVQPGRERGVSRPARLTRA